MGHLVYWNAAVLFSGIFQSFFSPSAPSPPGEHILHYAELLSMDWVQQSSGVHYMESVGNLKVGATQHFLAAWPRTNQQPGSKIQHVNNCCISCKRLGKQAISIIVMILPTVNTWNRARLRALVP